MAGRRSAICFGIFLDTTRLRSRRQRSQVARQAALSIMANTVVAFNASHALFLSISRPIPPYQYMYRYWYLYMYLYVPRHLTTSCSSRRSRARACVRESRHTDAAILARAFVATLRTHRSRATPLESRRRRCAAFGNTGSNQKARTGNQICVTLYPSRSRSSFHPSRRFALYLYRPVFSAKSDKKSLEILPSESRSVSASGLFLYRTRCPAKTNEGEVERWIRLSAPMSAHARPEPFGRHRVLAPPPLGSVALY
jgi:hypothetical protein